MGPSPGAHSHASGLLPRKERSSGTLSSPPPTLLRQGSGSPRTARLRSLFRPGVREPRPQGLFPGAWNRNNSSSGCFHLSSSLPLSPLAPASRNRSRPFPRRPPRSPSQCHMLHAYDPPPAARNRERIATVAPAPPSGARHGVRPAAPAALAMSCRRRRGLAREEAELEGPHAAVVGPRAESARPADRRGGRGARGAAVATPPRSGIRGGVERRWGGGRGRAPGLAPLFQPGGGGPEGARGAAGVGRLGAGPSGRPLRPGLGTPGPAGAPTPSRALFTRNPGRLLQRGSGSPLAHSKGVPW